MCFFSISGINQRSIYDSVLLPNTPGYYLHSVRRADAENPWSLQWIQIYWILHVYDLYHMAGLYPHIFYDITACRSAYNIHVSNYKVGNFLQR